MPVAVDGPGMIDQIRQFEDAKVLAAARQAEITVAFDLQQRGSRPLPGFLPMSKVPGSAPRWRWRGGSRPHGVAGYWAWPKL